ncbi:MAG: hypothetical protein IPK17_04610 [Chloroflexi bacterium]|uniref:hypothetical protein n=1 Tax=Candidatus Flexifilum breve TaxID=3140694 RepID=UPI003136E352|nr:hypothetical protein [Chloroflexota bacterium]
MGDSFLTALTEVTGLDVTEFANFERDRASEGLTLRDAISELTGDPALSDEVLSRANALLETALAEAADQGSLGDLDQQSLYSNGVEAFTIAMDEPEMPVISLPPDTERLGDEDVVILLSLIDGAVELNAGQEMTVYYIIDPPLRAITLGSVGTRHYYRVSARSVWSQAVASAGQVTNYMWRYPNGSQYGYYGVDVPGTPLPARLSMGTGSGTPTRTYDDRVVGGNGNTNTYTMYGVFTQCPSNGARDCG